MTWYGLTLVISMIITMTILCFYFIVSVLYMLFFRRYKKVKKEYEKTIKKD